MPRVCVYTTNYQGLLVKLPLALFEITCRFFRTGLMKKKKKRTGPMLAPGAHCASVYLEIPLKIV